MKDKILLFIGYIFILVAAIKFDIFIYPTLDYFGKFVFVGALNIVPFWIGWELNKKNKILPLIWGIICAGIFYYMS
jgi:hypothetical protein